METIEFLLAGFGAALQPGNLLFAVLGCFLGTLVGLLPGIGHNVPQEAPAEFAAAVAWMPAATSPTRLSPCCMSSDSGQLSESFGCG